MDGHIMRRGTIGSCQSAATSDCKALLVTSLTHVNGSIASVQTFTFTSVIIQAPSKQQQSNVLRVNISKNAT